MIPPGHLSVHRAYTQFKESLGDDAFGRLINLLRTGTLKAYTVDANSDVRKCDPVFWMNVSDAMRQEIFESVVLETLDHAFARKEIVVREDEFENTTGLSSRVSEAPTPETNRGRRPKYEWEAIWCGIVKVVHEYGENQTQSDLIQHVQDWFEKSFPGKDVPSESILQPKIAKMLQILKGTAPSVVFSDFAKQKPKARKKQKKPAK